MACCDILMLVLSNLCGSAAFQLCNKKILYAKFFMSMICSFEPGVEMLANYVQNRV
jgi:hypothetical protein